MAKVWTDCVSLCCETSHQWQIRKLWELGQSTIQYSTVQYTTVQYSIQYSTVLGQVEGVGVDVAPGVRGDEGVGVQPLHPGQVVGVCHVELRQLQHGTVSMPSNCGRVG